MPQLPALVRELQGQRKVKSLEEAQHVSFLISGPSIRCFFCQGKLKCYGAFQHDRRTSL